MAFVVVQAGVPIHAPSRPLLRDVPLGFVRERVTTRRRKQVDVSIVLAPFVDVLIVLVIFLLASFSVPEQAILPLAEHGRALAPAPVLVIDPRVVTLDGHRMADTATLGQACWPGRIESLVHALEAAQRNRRRWHAGQGGGRLIIQAHGDIEFHVLRSILFSAAQAGYFELNFAVERRDARLED